MPDTIPVELPNYDAAMKRKMFVAALGRLSDVNPDSDENHSIFDVKANA